MRAVILLLAGLALGVLGYGWWHAATHATLNVTLSDAAAKDKFGPVKGARLACLDDAGGVLATARTDDTYGVVWASHPVMGYCGPNLAQAAYATCFRAQSDWLPTWVPQATRVNIVIGDCRIERAPIRFDAYRDSAWTWWIPLPHVGGTPYTNYSAFLQINSATCAVAPLRG